MSTAIPMTRARPRPAPDTAQRTLRGAAVGWFAVAVVGQWFFAAYVALFYGASALAGDWERWNEVFPRGHLPGDPVGNAVVATHILLAIVLMIAGPLQFVPRLRARFPRLHRWTGRTFLVAATVAATAGLYLVWVRVGAAGDPPQRLGITLNGVAILVCAALALRHAVARRIEIHRRWALRLFLVVNGVWFFRVGLMAWLLVNGGPVGFDPESFTGPALTALSFGQTLLPLLVAEAFLRAGRSRGAIAPLAAAALLALATVVTAIGVFAAVVGMWLPRIT